MNDRYRRVYEMALRVLALLVARASDFSGIPIVQTYQTTIQTAVDEMTALGANKQSRTAGASDKTLHKGDARDILRDLLRDIADQWRVMYEEIKDEPNRFRSPRGDNDQTMLALARAAVQELPAFKAAFVERGFPEDFIAQIEAAIAAFADSITLSDTAHAERVGTNAAFAEPARTLRQTVDKLDPIVKRRYRQDPQALAEWLVASHIERAPKASEPPAPNPPNA